MATSTHVPRRPPRQCRTMTLVALPLLAADLTFARVRHGRVYSATSDWAEDRDPTVGETVLVADGEGRPIEATIERIDHDGTIALVIPAFAA
jgi:hypothetical protein